MSAEMTPELARVLHVRAKADWDRLKEQFLLTVKAIDKATPAIPGLEMSEPAWWQEMKNCERFVRGCKS